MALRLLPVSTVSGHSKSLPRPWPVLAQTFSILMTGLGLLSMANAAWHSTWTKPSVTCLYLLIALLYTGIRLRLPQLSTPLPVHAILILIASMELSVGETMLVACAAAALEPFMTLPGPATPRRPLCDVATAALAALVCHQSYHAAWLLRAGASDFIRLLITGASLYGMKTLPVAMATALSQRRSLVLVWKEINPWAFPYYLAGTGLAGLYHYGRHMVDLEHPVLLIPIGFVLYCTYHSFTARVLSQRSCTESMAALHLRTIEALALAIEAKDMTAHNHLQRLQLYCVEIGTQMGLHGDNLEALRAAAVLHDIGKLAVPEHILAKSGKLTREEFEKVKIHPLVGAEILDRVHFPYPVAALVRAHHEKWNGGGYPYGWKGEAIPLGSRILAVADCFDALISDRPYRAAVSKQEAMRRIAAESGVSFDPRIVEILQNRHRELEAKLDKRYADPEFASRDLAQLGKSLRLAAGASLAALETGKPSFFDSIAAARQEAQVQLELTQLLGQSLQLDETFPGLAAGLKRILPFDALAVYALHDEKLIPRYATGECTSILLSRTLHAGRGLAGWVAQHGKPLLNGNPAQELGLAAGETHGVLTSALAVPLRGTQGAVGVLMACRKRPDGFTKDNLRVILDVSAKLGQVMENALQYEKASVSANTDFLTGLPNARALGLQLDVELSRVRRLGGSLTVLVSDLDGFKQVNDRFGHSVGDTVLCEVAKALRLACREYDFVARMGGDEFVLLLPGLQESDAQQKIAHIHRAVSEASRAACAEVEVGLSVGQARFPDDGPDAEQLLATADRRMYLAKQLLRLKQHRGIPRGFDFDREQITPPVADVQQ